MVMASIQTRGIYRVLVPISLSSSMHPFFSAGKVLIFVTRKDNCAELAKNLKENGFTGKYFKDRIFQIKSPL
jgi:superfamily II DNA/RNA helicase